MRLAFFEDSELSSSNNHRTKKKRLAFFKEGELVSQSLALGARHEARPKFFTCIFILSYSIKKTRASEPLGNQRAVVALKICTLNY